MPPHAWSGKSDDGHDMVFRMLGGGPRKLGIEYMEIGEQLAGYFKLGGKAGVLVSSVDADGPAGKAGMKAGDIVLNLGNEKVEDGEDLREAVAHALAVQGERAGQFAVVSEQPVVEHTGQRLGIDGRQPDIAVLRRILNRLDRCALPSAMHLEDCRQLLIAFRKGIKCGKP